MRKSVIYGILVAIIVSSVSISSPVFAQQAGPANPNANVTTAYKLLHGNGTNATSLLSTTPPLSIKTDLPSYKQGDAVIVTGHVRELENATAVTLRVFSSLKNLISIAQLLPSSDGSFTKTFLATGPLWKDAGNYTIVAQYGKYTNDSVVFYYGGGNGESIVTPAISSTYTLQAGGVSYNIPYTIKGGKVNSMNIYADKLTLEVSITAQTDGALVIDLPRAMIDAKVPANLTKDQIMTGEKIDQSKLDDDKFIVAVNQKPVTQFTETKDADSRTLSIPFHAGDTTIDIVGTTIVPEFGPIAALVLAIAIVSIIAVSAKTGLRLMPRY
jgi:predicted secreted protein with PEFG-CTERM motif